jgi:phosphoglycolate phosphatase-like HAD superfamily hydrolase
VKSAGAPIIAAYRHFFRGFDIRCFLCFAAAAGIALLVALAPAHGQADALPSWNDGPAKQAIISFIADVTREGAPTHIPPAERIAVFDNDGTLWAEKPVYFQLLFAIDRVRALAPQHPEWTTRQPFKAAIEGDFDALAKSGEKGLVELVMATHAGITTEAFAKTVADWIATARHPRFQRPYTDLVYRPMLELLAYLRDSDFKTYIVSGGGIEFMRVWADHVYGVPPEQVIGSSIVTQFELKDGKPALVREDKIDFIDDKAGKPVAINKFIGRRPIFAFGNSDGDHQMLQWTAAGGVPRFIGLVHHTDAEREWAYDKDSAVGPLDKALDEARAKGWTVVDMKRDWKRVFAFEPK